MPKGNVYLPSINFQVMFNTLIEVVSVGKFHESHPTHLLSSMDDHGEICAVRICSKTQHLLDQVVPPKRWGSPSGILFWVDDSNLFFCVGNVCYFRERIEFIPNILPECLDVYEWSIYMIYTVYIYIHHSYIPKMNDFGKMCFLFQAIFLGGDRHGTANPRWSPTIPLQRSFQENVDNWELENCGHWILCFCLLFCRWKKPMNVMNVPVLGGFSQITSSCGKRKEMVLRNNFFFVMFNGDIHPNPTVKSHYCLKLWICFIDQMLGLQEFYPTHPKPDLKLKKYSKTFQQVLHEIYTCSNFGQFQRTEISYDSDLHRILSFKTRAGNSYAAKITRKNSSWIPPVHHVVVVDKYLRFYPIVNLIQITPQ